jgi:hypothetical protein
LWIPRETLGMFEAHLCVVVSDPNKDGASVLLCPIITCRNDEDPACKIEPTECGALPFVKVTSCIDHRSSIMPSLKTLTALLSDNVIRKREPIPPALLRRIRRDVIVSDFSSRGARKLLSDQGLTGGAAV